MADDIVTRLREAGLCGWNSQKEAANEIERLRAELAEAQNIIENLHTYLYNTGMWFICGCGRDRCTEMRVYLGTVKTDV